MISLQRSMHSSQMYTPGPAMSFLTCFCDLPQNEHFSSSPPSPNFATSPPAPLADARDLRHLGQLAGQDDFVDDAVVFSLVGVHDEVAVGVLADLLHGLAGVVGQHALQELAHAHDLLGLDLDVRRLAARSAVGLVDQDA